MNRGFRHYFREGMSASSQALFKSKGRNHFRYLLYFFAELLGRITLILTPLFDLAKVRQGRVLRTEKRYEPAQAFRRAGEPRSFWTLALCYLLEGLIILGGIILIGVFTAMLFGIGYGLTFLVKNGDMLPIYFAIPGGIVAVIFVVAALLIFAPTPYIIAANENIGVGDTLAVCYNTMKASGMGVLFLNVFLTTLPKIVYLGIFGGLSYILYDRFFFEKYCVLMLVGVDIVAILGYMLFAPLLTLGMRAANQHLFEDILVDPVAVSKASKGIRISQCRGQMFGEQTSRQALVAMFDDADAPTDDITFESKKKKRSKKTPAAEEIYGKQVVYAEQQPAEPVYEQPAAEPAEPVYEQPAVEPAEPVYEQPAVEPAEPVYEQPVAEPAEPVYEQPVEQPAEPVYEQPAAEPVEPVYEQPAAEPAEPVYEQPAAEPVEPVYEQPAVEPAEPVYEQPAAEPAEPVYEQPAEEPVEPVYEQPAAEPIQPIEEEDAEAEPAEEAGTGGPTAAKPKPVLRRRRLK